MVNAFDTYMAKYFEGETDPEEKRTWEGKLRSLRHVLIAQVNAIIDVYETGPTKKGLDPREGILWDVTVSDLKKYGVVLTADEKVFTFAKDADSSVTE